MDDDTGLILVAFLAGMGSWFAAQALVWWMAARRRRDLGAEPARTALIALSYGENAYRRSDNRPIGGIGILVACALLLLRPGVETWEYYLWGGFALLGLPGAWNDLHDFARELTVRPVLAAHDEGLYLTGWRGTVFLPWPEVALAYTDPPDSGGYIADEQRVMLCVESKSGRSWRYSSRDFAEGAPAEFARLVELVTLRTAPPDSMLTRGRL